jgi:leucyl-tRNA synthetase
VYNALNAIVPIDKAAFDAHASKTISESEAILEAKKIEKVIPFLEGKTIKKEIYVKEKLVNLVVV